MSASSVKTKIAAPTAALDIKSARMTAARTPDYPVLAYRYYLSYPSRVFLATNVQYRPLGTYYGKLRYIILAGAIDSLAEQKTITAPLRGIIQTISSETAGNGYLNWLNPLPESEAAKDISFVLPNINKELTAIVH